MQRFFSSQQLLVGLLLNASVLVAQALEVSEGYVRGMPPGQANTAAFLRIDNPGDSDWLLSKACSSAAEKVELHSHEMHGGMMAMREVESVRVPAGGSFRFQPGGHHIMLVGLKRALREGDTVTLTLCDVQESCLSVDLPVRSVLNEPHHQHH